MPQGEPNMDMKTPLNFLKIERIYTSEDLAQVELKKQTQKKL